MININALADTPPKSATLLSPHMERISNIHDAHMAHFGIDGTPFLCSIGNGIVVVNNVTLRLVFQDRFYIVQCGELLDHSAMSAKFYAHLKGKEFLIQGWSFYSINLVNVSLFGNKENEGV